MEHLNVPERTPEGGPNKAQKAPKSCRKAANLASPAGETRSAIPRLNDGRHVKSKPSLEGARADVMSRDVPALDGTRIAALRPDTAAGIRPAPAIRPV
jgi:hypothetical protein